MSILIKGMEMPNSCISCRLMVNCDTCEGWECICTALDENIGYLADIPDNRREDCPLIELPPHGRLIDGDAFLAKYFDGTESNIRRAIVITPSVMNSAPTIIESEAEV